MTGAMAVSKVSVRGRRGKQETMFEIYLDVEINKSNTSRAYNLDIKKKWNIS